LIWKMGGREGGEASFPEGPIGIPLEKENGQNPRGQRPRRDGGEGIVGKDWAEGIGGEGGIVRILALDRRTKGGWERAKGERGEGGIQPYSFPA